MSSVSGSLAVSAAVGNAAVTEAGAAATVPSSSLSSVLVTEVGGLLDSGDSVAIGSAAGPSESGSFSSSLVEGAVGVAAAALTLMLTSVAASLFDSASSSTEPGLLSVVMLSVGLSERFRFWLSLSSLLSGSNSLARFLPLIGVSALLLPFCPLPDAASSFLLGVFGLSTGVVSGVSVPPRLGRLPVFPVVTALLLLLLALACCCCCCCCCSFAVGFWRVLILDGESSPVSPPPPPAAAEAAVATAAAAAAAATAAAALSLMALVALESLSHSLMSSSVTELFSSFEMGDGRDEDSVTADDGSGVASFLLLLGGVLLLLLALLLVRVLRRRSEPARRRRCGRLLFAPGVFFHR